MNSNSHRTSDCVQDFGTGSTKLVSAWTAFLFCIVISAAACSGGGGSGVVTGQGGGDSGAGGGNPILGASGGDHGGGTPPGTDIGSGGGGGSGTGGSTGGGGGGTTTGGGGGGTASGGGGNGGGGTVIRLDPVTLSPSTSNSTTRAIAAFPGNSVTGTSGVAVLPINIENATSFQVITESTGAFIAAALLDPSDNVIVNFIPPETTPQQTSAVYLLANTNTMPYPTSPFDTGVVDGTYNQNILVDPLRNPFSAQVIAKRDPDLSSGVLRVNIVLVGSDAQAFRNSVKDALHIWQAIYASVGITVVADENFPFVPGDGTGLLPNPVVGSLFYLQQAQSLPADSINVFIGSGIAGDDSTGPGNTLDALGVAPSVPGPDAATLNSAIAIDILSHAGNDGVLDNFDLELLGETMAHETGHYLGLFHPVEFADDTKTTFVAGDRLTDTALCSTLTECTGTGVASNLMFPSPVSGVFQQRDLSGQQTQVMQSQVVVD